MRRYAKAPSAGSTQRQARSSASSGAHSVLPLAIFGAILLLVISAASALAASMPTISSTAVSAVTSTTVVLEAEVNPQGEATTYHFEYGLAPCSSNPCESFPLPAASIGSGESAKKVAKEVNHLEPGTTYYYRVLATNGTGTAEGPDRTFSTYARSNSDTNCPNQVFRTGAAAFLPDCRAYEMVSPVDKNGRGIKPTNSLDGGRPEEVDMSSMDGQALTYSTSQPFGDAVSAPFTVQYIARRNLEGWTTHSISPPRHGVPTNAEALTRLNSEFVGFSEDLETSWLNSNLTPALVPDAIEGAFNLYRRDNATNDYKFIAGDFQDVALGGFSPDGSKTVFTTPAKLTDGASSGGNNQVYELSDAGLHLVSVLPNGEASTEPSYLGSPLLRGFRYMNVYRAVSDDGSHIFWSTGPEATKGEGRIYVRIDDSETVPVSEEAEAEVNGEKALFWTAATDGSKAVFSAVGTGSVTGENLYEFDVAGKTTNFIAGKLTGVLGASEDASRIYFVSREVLTPGAVADQANIYLYEVGTGAGPATYTLIASDSGGLGWATLVGEPVGCSLGSKGPSLQCTRVTPDGSHLAFVSAGKEIAEQTANYDNLDAVSGQYDAEVYLYNAEDEKLNCVSCNPSGARPVGFERSINQNPIGVAAQISGWETASHPPRELSPDGSRLFFESYDALAPGDTNGKKDVYEWEAAGVGSCREAGASFSERNGGCVSLITSGESPEDSEFVDASLDGEDVFFKTNESLLPQDPGLIDIYDARIAGGFPQPPAAAACEGEACQGPPSPPNDPTPASSAYRGPGNVVEKPVRKKSRKGRHHRKKGHHRQRANPHRRTAR